MSYAVVTLKKGEGRTLKAGGAWVFDNEIESITGGFTWYLHRQKTDQFSYNLLYHICGLTRLP